ncbi:hypothetical protein BJ166DRAFT_235447 [Pestalotiopsis sp. NC0098]|nr:hypothetical protein BJ166DRAFT_235447 [Pestalotiopsis sp. NC0098]
MRQTGLVGGWTSLFSLSFFGGTVANLYISLSPQSNMGLGFINFMQPLCRCTAAHTKMESGEDYKYRRAPMFMIIMVGSCYLTITTSSTSGNPRCGL